MPHPLGKISVNYKLTGEKWNFNVTLPMGLDGTFVWNGKSYNLKSGENKMNFE